MILDDLITGLSESKPYIEPIDCDRNRTFMILDDLITGLSESKPYIEPIDSDQNRTYMMLNYKII